MASALAIDEAMNMIDHEDDDPQEGGTSSSSTTTSKPTSSSSSANNDESSSLGAIFQTAYTSNSSQSSSNTSRANPASLASATASGPRVSNTSDLFAPEMDVFFEDSTSQLFADDDDDEVDHHHGPEHVQALFVDTSSPRRSPTPGATPGVSATGFPSSRSASWWQMAPTPSS